MVVVFFLYGTDFRDRTFLFFVYLVPVGLYGCLVTKFHLHGRFGSALVGLESVGRLCRRYYFYNNSHYYHLFLISYKFCHS